MEEHMCFYDQNFLQAQPLTASNIISYFSISQFYDKNCLNEILKMQSQFATIDISHRLTSTVGFYYILEHEAENLFVIAKKEFDGEKTRLLAIYYCMFGSIYCAPTVKAVSDYNLTYLFWHLNGALDIYERNTRFNWAEDGHKVMMSQDERKKEEDKHYKDVTDALYDFSRHIND